MEKKWYQKVSNWIFGIIVIILLGILAINIHITLQAKNNEDVVPNVFGYKPFIVLSGSMEKEIHKGDLIITKMIEPETLKISDVIAFRDNENTVTTHRIIDIVEKNNNTYFVTKGDNNNSQDQNLVEYKDVEGIYVTRIPMVGTVLSELAKPANAIIIVLGISIIFILLFTRSNRKLRLEEEKEFLEYKKQKELMNNKIELPKKKEVNEPATTASKKTTKTTTNSSSSKKSTTKVVKNAPVKEAKKATTKTVVKKTTTSSAKKTTAKVAPKKTPKAGSTKKVATKKSTPRQNSRKHS